MTDENIVTILSAKAQEELTEKTKSEVTENDPTNAEEVIQKNIQIEK